MTINGFNSELHIESTLLKALAGERFPHTSIIEGGTAEERTALGNKIAAALICDDEAQRPCGKCNHCRKSEQGLHPDIIIQNPSKTESGNLLYRVDDIREIRSSVLVVPNEAEKKIFILSEAQVMNIQAQNAFLKILEEPPAYTVFILLCSTKSVFLPTVISRATVYSLGDVNEISNDFPKEKIIECSEKIVLAAATGNDFELVKAAGAFEKNQKLLHACLPVISEMFASALRLKFNAEQAPEFECSEKAASRMSKSALLSACESMEKINKSLNMNANLNLTLGRLCTLLRS